MSEADDPRSLHAYHIPACNNFSRTRELKKLTRDPQMSPHGRVKPGGLAGKYSGGEHDEDMGIYWHIGDWLWKATKL